MKLLSFRRASHTHCAMLQGRLQRQFKHQQVAAPRSFTRNFCQCAPQEMSTPSFRAWNFDWCLKQLTSSLHVHNPGCRVVANKELRAITRRMQARVQWSLSTPDVTTLSNSHTVYVRKWPTQHAGFCGLCVNSTGQPSACANLQIAHSTEGEWLNTNFAHGSAFACDGRNWDKVHVMLQRTGTHAGPLYLLTWNGFHD